MISYLKGNLISKNNSAVIVEVNNIGYLITVNSQTLQKLPEPDCEVKIHTVLIHKEDSMQLCGFLTSQERDMFNLLQTVSGIGVKAALAILELPLSDIISAVISENDTVLSKVKGIGAKTAKRLVLELKDKIKSMQTDLNIVVSDTANSSFNPVTESEGFAEAFAVLNTLGYTACEITSGLEFARTTVKDKNNTEEILQLALNSISKG